MLALEKETHRVEDSEDEQMVVATLDVKYQVMKKIHEVEDYTIVRVKRNKVTSIEVLTHAKQN